MHLCLVIYVQSSTEEQSQNNLCHFRISNFAHVTCYKSLKPSYCKKKVMLLLAVVQLYIRWAQNVIFLIFNRVEIAVCSPIVAVNRDK